MIKFNVNFFEQCYNKNTDLSKKNNKYMKNNSIPQYAQNINQRIQEIIAKIQKKIDYDKVESNLSEFDSSIIIKNYYKNNILRMQKTISPYGYITNLDIFNEKGFMDLNITNDLTPRNIFSVITTFYDGTNDEKIKNISKQVFDLSGEIISN